MMSQFEFARAYQSPMWLVERRGIYSYLRRNWIFYDGGAVYEALR